MRWILGTVGVLAALYAGAWFVGERMIETRAAAALENLRAQGWTVDYASLDTTGFPSRFDTTLTDPSLADPEGRVAWAAPFVQVFMLSYRPNRVIAVWPTEQRVTVNGRALEVTSEDLRASGWVGLAAGLPLRAATLEGHAVAVAGAGPTVEASRLLAAVRDAGPGAAGGAGAGGAGEGRAYDLHLDAEGIAAGARGLLDRVALDARATLDRPVTLSPPAEGAEAPPPRLLALDLAGVRLTRGEQSLALSGALAPDAQGYAAGTLTLVAENWRGMLGLAEQVGAIGADRRALLEGAFAAIESDDGRIEVDVTFEGGRVSVGGLPLLAAPRLLP